MRFFTKPPTPQQLVAEAKRLGGIDIDMLDQTGHGLTVAFSDFPQGRVNISTSAQNRLLIIDLSLVAPVLFRLLCRAGISLGGHSKATVANPPLPLPLTRDAIRKATRQVHLKSALDFFLLILLLAAAVVLVVGVFWLLAQYAF